MIIFSIIFNESINIVWKWLSEYFQSKIKLKCLSLENIIIEQFYIADENEEGVK